jgi:hypothetical protein
MMDSLRDSRKPIFIRAKDQLQDKILLFPHWRIGCLGHVWAGMPRLAAGLPAFGGWHPALALGRRRIGGWGPAGVGGVLVQAHCEGFKTFKEREHEKPHA